jgi:hypothetical protein
MSITPSSRNQETSTTGESDECETRVWIKFAVRCDYPEDGNCNKLDKDYDPIITQILNMIIESDKWLIKLSPFPLTPK